MCKCSLLLWPMRIVVERANRYHVFAQSQVKSLRIVAFAVGHWSSSMVKSLFWRLSIVELSQFLTQAFKFAPGSTVRMEQRAFGGILRLLRSDWSLRWLDVCICTDASEKGLREGCRELAPEVGRVSERTRFKRSSRSILARSRALRPIASEAGLECCWSDDVTCP